MDSANYERVALLLAFFGREARQKLFLFPLLAPDELGKRLDLPDPRKGQVSMKGLTYAIQWGLREAIFPILSERFSRLTKKRAPPTLEDRLADLTSLLNDWKATPDWTRAIRIMRAVVYGPDFLGKEEAPASFLLDEAGGYKRSVLLAFLRKSDRLWPLVHSQLPRPLRSYLYPQQYKKHLDKRRGYLRLARQFEPALFPRWGLFRRRLSPIVFLENPHRHHA